jgi:hypothetical protein
MCAANHGYSLVMKRTRTCDLGCPTQTASRPQLPSVYYPRPQTPTRLAVVLATPAFREPKARRKDATSFWTKFVPV